MKRDVKKLIFCLLLPLAVGALAALLTRDAMTQFDALNKPPLSPPAWLFPVVWTVLYLLMGLASYFMLQSDGSAEEKRTAWVLYCAQLGVNFVWPLIFFGLAWYLVAFFWLLLLWFLVYLTANVFSKLRSLAGWLLLPYLLWVTFAGYLNLTISLLN